MVTIRDSWVRRLVQLLDGSRSLTVITMTLLQEMQAGELPELELKEEEDGPEITDPIRQAELLEERIKEILLHFLEQGAFIG